MRGGEKGVDIVTPFFTHNSKDGNAQAIMVNRGWMSWDMRHWRYDKKTDDY